MNDQTPQATATPDGAASALNAGLEAAPPNNLPTWAECVLRVDNSDFIAKRVAEGGYGPDADTKLATQLHRLELVLEEAKWEASNAEVSGEPKRSVGESA